MAGSACVSRSPDGIRAMQAALRSTPWWGGCPDVSRLGRENRRGGYVGRDAHHSRSTHPLTAPVPAQVRGVASVAGRARVEQSPHREPDILADRAWAESEALRQNANAHLLGGRWERILRRLTPWGSAIRRVARSMGTAWPGSKPGRDTQDRWPSGAGSWVGGYATHGQVSRVRLRFSDGDLQDRVLWGRARRFGHGLGVLLARRQRRREGRRRGPGGHERARLGRRCERRELELGGCSGLGFDESGRDSRWVVRAAVHAGETVVARRDMGRGPSVQSRSLRWRRLARVHHHEQSDGRSGEFAT